VRLGQADREIGPGPAVLQRAEAARVEPILAERQRVEMGSPRGDGVGLVQPAEPGDRLPQLRGGGARIQIGEHPAPQAGAAAATTDQFVSLREMRSRNGRTARAVACWRALMRCGSSPLQLVRVVGVHRQDGVAGVGVRRERLGQPAREVVERLGGAVREPRHEHGLVAPEHLDERGAGAVGAGGNLTDERRRFQRDAAAGQRADDDQALAGLKVQTDPDGQVGIRGEVHRESKYNEVAIMTASCESCSASSRWPQPRRPRPAP
jgi:hypothetical protein